MELELGLKITQSTGDITSTTNLRIAKDSSGPVFISRETDTKFILTAHLKGFVREQIGININEEGTEISISGERPVREMVMSGWMMHKKDVELKGFIKVFRIPNGVILDRIKAKFNNQESVLTILIPKSTKGIRGVGVEEVKEEEVVDRLRPKAEIDQATTSEEVNDNALSVGKVEEETEQIKPNISDDEAQEEGDHIVGDGIEEKPKELNIETRHVSEEGTELQGKRREELKVDEPKSEDKKKESNGVDEKKVVEEIKGEHAVFDEIPKRDETKDKARIQEPEIITSEEQHKVESTTAPKEETPATIETSQEVKPEIPKQAPPPPSEEAERKEFPDIKEQTPKEINAFEPKSSEILEHVQSEPYHEKENKDEIQKVKSEDEARQGEKQTEEKESSCADGSPMVEKQEAIKEKPKPAGSSRRMKLCAPCVIAGSTIIVSIVVFAVHWIRTKKREVH